MCSDVCLPLFAAGRSATKTTRSQCTRNCRGSPRCARCGCSTPFLSSRQRWACCRACTRWRWWAAPPAGPPFSRALLHLAAGMAHSQWQQAQRQQGSQPQSSGPQQQRQRRPEQQPRPAGVGCARFTCRRMPSRWQRCRAGCGGRWRSCPRGLPGWSCPTTGCKSCQRAHT